MSKKRFLAMLLAGVMTLGLATGCSNGTSGDTTAEDGGSEGGSYKIALIQQHQTNAFQIAVSEAAQAKADELGVELNIVYPKAMTLFCLSLLIRTACVTLLR